MNKKVLIFENNLCHGECLPSYIKYFKDLGYEVSCIGRERVLNENPLCLMGKIPTLIISDNDIGCNSLLESTLLKNSDIIFVCSFNKESYEIAKKIQIKYPKKLILFQVHSNLQYFLKEGSGNKNIIKNTFSLGVNKEFPRISPVYFGNINKRVKEKDSLKLFISGLDKIHERTFNLFKNVIQELNEEDYNIEVKVCGVRRQWEPEFTEYIKNLGRISFEELYKNYQEADFLVVLFDEFDEKWSNVQKSFMNGRVSGSRQSSLGFGIPLILQKGYQKSWDLDDSNSISYEKDNLKEAIIKAYKMSSTKYKSMVKSLNTFQECLIREAENNISKKLSETKNKNYSIKEQKVRIIINPDGSRKKVM